MSLPRPRNFCFEASSACTARLPGFTVSFDSLLCSDAARFSEDLAVVDSLMASSKKTYFFTRFGNLMFRVAIGPTE